MAEEARDDEREALIREVRMTLSSVASHGPSALTSTHDPMYTADLLSRLAKALGASSRKHPEPEWEYGTGIPSALGGYWDEEPFPNLEDAREHAEDCDEGCVLLRRRPEQPAGPWVPVEEGEQ